MCAPFAVIIIDYSVHYVTINLSTVDEWLWVDSMLFSGLILEWMFYVLFQKMCKRSYVYTIIMYLSSLFCGNQITIDFHNDLQTSRKFYGVTL